MKVEQTELTPELAAQLLSTLDPRQVARLRGGRLTVAAYERAIREGRWRLVGDPILVSGGPTPRLFNGAHRCSAVVAAKQSIPVLISWDADPATFDLIDSGRKRAAYQFIDEGQATARASAARVTLWHERRFDRPLSIPATRDWDTHELLLEAVRRRAAFDCMVHPSAVTYARTGIPRGVALGAFALAYDQGCELAVDELVGGLVGDADGSPWGRALADRYQLQAHRARRRPLGEDWTMLVRALNGTIHGEPPTRLVGSVKVWPKVGEPAGDYNRRAKVIFDREARQRRSSSPRESRSSGTT